MGKAFFTFYPSTQSFTRYNFFFSVWGKIIIIKIKACFTWAFFLILTLYTTVYATQFFPIKALNFSTLPTKACPVGAHMGKWREGGRGRGRAITNSAYKCLWITVNNPQLFSVNLDVTCAA
jgi:hypothetical protein